MAAARTALFLIVTHDVDQTLEAEGRGRRKGAVEERQTDGQTGRDGEIERNREVYINILLKAFGRTTRKPCNGACIRELSRTKREAAGLGHAKNEHDNRANDFAPTTYKDVCPERFSTPAVELISLTPSQDGSSIISRGLSHLRKNE